MSLRKYLRWPFPDAGVLPLELGVL
ncbi:uncharacterized protein METZ01_LOCUS505220, partial [marine metagenome]